jgi:hypothetical protein
LINSNSLPELIWASRLGASGPGAVSFPGITLPATTLPANTVPATTVPANTVPATTASATSGGTGPCASVARASVARAMVTHAVPRVRGEVSLVALPPRKDAVLAQLGQTNIHNYMTRAYAVGEGASGPPRKREPV